MICSLSVIWGLIQFNPHTNLTQPDYNTSIFPHQLSLLPFTPFVPAASLSLLFLKHTPGPVPSHGICTVLSLCLSGVLFLQIPTWPTTYPLHLDAISSVRHPLTTQLKILSLPYLGSEIPFCIKRYKSSLDKWPILWTGKEKVQDEFGTSCARKKCSRSDGDMSKRHRGRPGEITALMG